MAKQLMVEKKEYQIDAAGKILGRMATQAAVLLRGKNTASWLPYITPQNEVIIFNTDKIKVTGKKMEQKFYRHHTGYPGGLKEESLAKLLERDSREVIKLAIYGMLPRNKTRDKIIKNLKLFKGPLR